MLKTAVIAAALSTVAASNLFDREVYEREFYDHVQKYGLTFKDGAEFVHRLQVFVENYDFIHEHNKAGKTFTLGLNEYAHLSLQEFHDLMHLGGTRPPNLRRNPEGPEFVAAEGTANPASVDHVALGNVSPVKNQGSCGSCWSFSAVGAIESAVKIKYGVLNNYSEQQLVSCDNVDAGCNGGWMDDAFTWVKNNGGITTDAAYPYTSGSSGKSGTCVKTGYTNDARTAPSRFVDVQTKSVTSLEAAVVGTPVSIAIQANQPEFQFYSGGVLTGRCGTRLDHGVLLVGYGTDNGTPYWKVKNSWGTSWGEAGYIRIEKSSSDLCGVLDAPSYPVL